MSARFLLPALLPTIARAHRRARGDRRDCSASLMDEAPDAHREAYDTPRSQPR